MAKDLGDVIGHTVGRVARETVETVSSNAHKASNKAAKSPLAGPKGLAAGAGLVALAPLAARGAGKVVKQRMSGAAVNPVKKARDAVGGTVKNAVDKKVEDAGGPAGIAKEAGKGLIPGIGGKDDKPKGAAAIGNGRRMPVQQAVDVAVPISTAYNQWTQFEEWPTFMHRLQSVSQEDETHVSFKTKIWGISREFKAEIEDQRPDERIKWKVTEGVSHTGVVTFHQLADRLTRVDVDVFVEPGSLIEKAGRGMRHVKRAIRADLARFKAYVELEEEETGASRGEIDDAKVKSTTRSASASGRSRSASGRRSTASSGSRSKRASSGSRGTSASSGSRSKSASSGSRNKPAASGGRTKSASSGSRSGSSSGRSGSNGRSGSSGASGTRAASNGQTGSRSGRKQTAGSRS